MTNRSERFEYLPKTADVRFRAFGKTLEELFINSAMAMINVMVDSETIEKLKTKKITVKAENNDKLLIKFLEEILFLLDTEGFLTGSVREMDIKNKEGSYELTAVLSGDNKTEKYELSSGVKAVTYNDFIFKKTKEGFITEITLDT